MKIRITGGIIEVERATIEFPINLATIKRNFRKC
jgi:hypothetical protein